MFGFKQYCRQSIREGHPLVVLTGYFVLSVGRRVERNFDCPLALSQVGVQSAPRLVELPQLGENTATADAKITGDGSITLNSRYLLDGLNALSGDEVVFSFNGKLEPTLLHDPAASDYKHIIMPLKS